MGRLLSGEVVGAGEGHAECRDTRCTGRAEYARCVGYAGYAGVRRVRQVRQVRQVRRVRQVRGVQDPRTRHPALLGAAGALSCVLILAGCGGGNNDGSGARTAAASPSAWRARAPPNAPSRPARAARSTTTSTVTAPATSSSTTSCTATTATTRASASSTESKSGLRPGARQLLSAHANGARTKGELPAAFESEAACDLDKDGFTDLIVSTDPPYDGQGRPPVPLQILFGSPKGLTGKAVKLRVPAQARFGNDWPDQPVCGDFDGDGANDLVLHASEARLSYLRGPFKRTGAPRAAGKPSPGPATTSSPAGPRTWTATATTTYSSARPRTRPAPPSAPSSWAARRGPPRPGCSSRPARTSRSAASARARAWTPPSPRRPASRCATTCRAPCAARWSRQERVRGRRATSTGTD